ncbi:MAG: SDR family NAD(P)-dependent oxidoreductase [Rickettsiales bacterium]
MPAVLITGASSGIGVGLAAEYARADTTLILLGRNQERLEQIASVCRTEGARVEVAAIDVRDKAAMAEFILRMDDVTPIDLVIANAGISTGSFSGEETLAAAEAVFEINVTGVINTIHPIVPRMTARGHGQIAIMSSLAGICALPGAPAYSASKAAVRVYGDALRGKLKASGVHVSVICPGWISTPLTAKNDFPMPFIMPVSDAATRIKRGLSKKKSRIAFPFALYFPLRVFGILPVSWCDALFVRLPAKR